MRTCKVTRKVTREGGMDSSSVLTHMRKVTCKVTRKAGMKVKQRVDTQKYVYVEPTRGARDLKSENTTSCRDAISASSGNAAGAPVEGCQEHLLASRQRGAGRLLAVTRTRKQR